MLQQQFNERVFAREAALYEEEGIEATAARSRSPNASRAE